MTGEGCGCGGGCNCGQATLSLEGSTAHEQSLTEQVLAEVEALRSRDGEPMLEVSLSVNDWIDRVRAACTTAHGQARAAATWLEYETWLEVAAIAVGRAESIRRLAGE